MTNNELDKLWTEWFKDSEIVGNDPHFIRKDAFIAELDALITEAEFNGLKKIWNATQPDIAPDGWQPESLEAKMIQERLAQLNKELEEK